MYPIFPQPNTIKFSRPLTNLCFLQNPATTATFSDLDYQKFGTISYSITGVWSVKGGETQRLDPSFVRIDATSGDIKNNGTLDFEVMAELRIEVLAKDGGNDPPAGDNDPNAMRSGTVVREGESERERQREKRERQREKECIFRTGRERDRERDR